MLDDLVDLLVVVLFNQRRVPLDRDMKPLEEVVNILICRGQNTPTAHVHPVALRAAIPAPVHYLQDKRLEDLLLVIG